MESNREKILGLDRNIFFTGISSFLTDTSTKMVYSVMPLFLLSIGASKTTISLIEGIAESTASLLKALSGVWSDRISKNKPFMIIGYAITAIITPIYFFVNLPSQVLYLRFIERVGKGLRTAPRDSLISSSSDKSETGRSFGYHKAMDNSGAIFGPLIAFVMLYLFPLNYKYIFIIAAVPAVIGVFAIILFIIENPVKKSSSGKNVSYNRLPKKYYLFLVIIAVFALGNSTDALLLIKTSETGINNSYIPFIYMIFNVVSVLTAIPVGKISDKIGREKLIIAGFIIYSIVYFLFGKYNSIGIFIILFILYGLYSALTDSSQKAMVSDLVEKENKGTGFGIYHAVLGITLLPASLIAGYLYDKVNSSAPFYFGAFMSLTAAVLMILFSIHYRYEKK